MVNPITALFVGYAVIVLIILVISALPLYLAVKFIGGETGIVKVILTSMLLSFVAFAAIRFLSIFAGIFMIIATLFVYSIAFKISILKAFFAWILQYIFVFLMVLAVVLIFGIPA